MCVRYMSSYIKKRLIKFRVFLLPCKVKSLNVIDTKKRKKLQWRPLHGSLSGSFFLFIFLFNFIYLLKFISSSEIATERSIVKNKVR